MPSPETSQNVVELVRRVGLVPESDLTRFLAGLPAGTPSSKLLGKLTSAGLLTAFQAEEITANRGQGLRLGAYKLLDRLGKGGMGHVFLGEHAVLGKRVAVKVLSAGLRSDAGARRRFVREARAAAAIDHPNVVHVFDVDMDHDPPFLVMEFVEGVNLQVAVARRGTFTGGETAAVGVELARGLQAAAAHGLVHRDIKPANLLVNRVGGVKILDLGIVRFVGDETQTNANSSNELLGTLDYLAPEQAVNPATVDPRADLYALGATLYFLLAGHPPFPGADFRRKLTAKLHVDPPPVHQLRPDVDAGLSLVIQTLLARDPDARYAAAVDVVAALAPFVVLPANFPARLFRENQSSSADNAPVSAELHSPPPTQRMKKPPLHPIPPPPLPRETTEEGPPTARMASSPTDLTMTPLPSAYRQTPRPVIAPRPLTPQRFLRVFARFLLVMLTTIVAAMLVRKMWN